MMRIVKITTIVCVLSILMIPVIGATTNNPNSYNYNLCKGMAFGEIEDYKLSPIAYFRYLLKGKPSTLLVTRAKIVIKQEPDMISLELIDPIKRCCMEFQGNITIHFWLSMITINL